MIKKLAMLIVEDSEADAELIVRELQDGGFDPFYERVETQPDMIAALERRDWDIVISDYSMPQFGGDAALALLQNRGVDVPFISVSGTMGEDVAVAMMKAGAHDYVMKDDLKRLVPAVERELEAAIVRREHRRDEASRALLAAIVASSDDAIISTNLDGMVLSWNRGAEQMFGHAATEIISQPISVLIPRDRPNEMTRIFEKFKQGEHAQRYETVRVRKDGKYVTVSLTISPVKDTSGKVIGASSIARDVTERKREEAERLQLIHELTNALQRVKTLSGLLPICAACKKIRDDRGYWQSVEVYIRDHSDAEFSHSICPECMVKQYPDMHGGSDLSAGRQQPW
jgi:PAS domain S-box-containing protein